ncbi:hypothetical protein GW17_00020311 [Ensete ventricosum]|nr:hypothetical protein GW17_00020311 [Ensete ventricosum]
MYRLVIGCIVGTPWNIDDTYRYLLYRAKLCISARIGLSYITQRERKKKWDEKNQEAISEALRQLNEFDKVINFFLLAICTAFSEIFSLYQCQSYDDRGPVIDIVVWNDGDVWRVAIDTQSLEDSSDTGKLADFVPLTNYRFVQSINAGCLAYSTKCFMLCDLLLLVDVLPFLEQATFV